MRSEDTVDDKVFDLMTQMYSELQNISGQVGNLDQRLAKIEKDIIRLEDKVDSGSRALFDGYTQTYEKLSMVDEKVDALRLQVEKQDVEIKVIRNIGIN